MRITQMHKILNVDNDGRLSVVFEPEPDEMESGDKSENIKHLRKMQSTNFLGRSILKVHDLFARKQEAA
jgi:hypothetical protein